jgi:hypothetical protein
MMIVLHRKRWPKYSVYMYCAPFFILMGSGTTITESIVPEITLSNGTRIQNGSLGSYCWNNICEDRPLQHNVSNPTRIILEKNSTIIFDIKGYTEPEKYHVAIFDMDNFSAPVIFDQEISGDNMKLNISDGMYLLTLMASWPSKGDVSYIFPISIVDRQEK